VATLGLFSPELVPKAWFSPELYPLAWFDRTLVGAAAAVSFSDASVPVQVLVGAESASFVLVNDTSVPVSAFVGVETTVFVLFDDTSVPVNAFAGQETVDVAFDEAGVPVVAFVGLETLEFSFDGVGTVVSVFAGAETVESSFEDAGVPAEVFAGEETVEPAVQNVSALAEALVGEEVFGLGFEDESVAVQAVALSETVSVGPTPPGPSPSPKPVLAGGTPLEDYEVGGYTLRELREVREALEEGGSLLEEIVELPVREESADEKKERESGEPRFSNFLKQIIEEPVKPRAEKKATNWLPWVALGAFALGVLVASGSESEAFAGEEPEDDLLPDELPDDLDADLDDEMLVELPPDREEDEFFVLDDEPLPVQGPEHVDPDQFAGEGFSGEQAYEDLVHELSEELEPPKRSRRKKAPRQDARPEPISAEKAYERLFESLSEPAPAKAPKPRASRAKAAKPLKQVAKKPSKSARKPKTS
jgi:hypothetical protein